MGFKFFNNKHPPKSLHINNKQKKSINLNHVTTKNNTIKQRSAGTNNAVRVRDSIRLGSVNGASLLALPQWPPLPEVNRVVTLVDPRGDVIAVTSLLQRSLSSSCHSRCPESTSCLVRIRTHTVGRRPRRDTTTK